MGTDQLANRDVGVPVTENSVNFIGDDGSERNDIHYYDNAFNSK